MSDPGRQTLTDIFENLHQEIIRKGRNTDYEAEYKRLIIRELEDASQRAMLYLQLTEAGRK